MQCSVALVTLPCLRALQQEPGPRTPGVRPCSNADQDEKNRRDTGCSRQCRPRSFTTRTFRVRDRWLKRVSCLEESLNATRYDLAPKLVRPSCGVGLLRSHAVRRREAGEGRPVLRQ